MEGLRCNGDGEDGELYMFLRTWILILKVDGDAVGSLVVLDSFPLFVNGSLL